MRGVGWNCHLQAHTLAPIAKGAGAITKTKCDCLGQTAIQRRSFAWGGHDGSARGSATKLACARGFACRTIPTIFRVDTIETSASHQIRNVPRRYEITRAYPRCLVYSRRGGWFSWPHTDEVTERCHRYFLDVVVWNTHEETTDPAYWFLDTSYLVLPRGRSRFGEAIFGFPVESSLSSREKSLA